MAYRDHKRVTGRIHVNDERDRYALLHAVKHDDVSMSPSDPKVGMWVDLHVPNLIHHPT